MSKDETQWFVSVLALFAIILIFLEASIYEIAIVMAVYFVSWFIVSSLVKRQMKNGELQSSTSNELKWYGGTLTLFFLVLLLLGPPTPINIAIGIGAYTLIWILRSYLIKMF